MRYRISLLIAASAALAAGCFQSAALIELNADGSGRLLIRGLTEKRYATNEVEKGFATLLGQANRERLARYAEELGEGVRFASIERVENASGWVGVQAVFDFDDIEHLHLPVDFTSVVEDELRASRDKADPGDNRFSDDKYRFSFTSGKRPVFSVSVVAPIEKPPAPDVDDPFADAGIDLPQAPATPPGSNLLSEMAIELMKPSLKTARISTVVRLPGEVTETSAPSQPNSDSILLLDMRLGEMTQSGAFENAVQEKWRLDTLLRKKVAGIRGIQRGETATTKYRSQ